MGVLIHTIEASSDSTNFEGVMLKRPSYVAPSEWLDFWEEVNIMNKEFFEDPASWREP